MFKRLERMAHLDGGIGGVRGQWRGGSGCESKAERAAAVESGAARPGER